MEIFELIILNYLFSKLIETTIVALIQFLLTLGHHIRVALRILLLVVVLHLHASHRHLQRHAHLHTFNRSLHHHHLLNDRRLLFLDLGDFPAHAFIDFCNQFFLPTISNFHADAAAAADAHHNGPQNPEGHLNRTNNFSLLISKRISFVVLLAIPSIVRSILVVVIIVI